MQVDIELRDGSRLIYTNVARAYHSRNLLVIVYENGEVITWEIDGARMIGAFK